MTWGMANVPPHKRALAAGFLEELFNDEPAPKRRWQRDGKPQPQSAAKSADPAKDRWQKLTTVIKERPETRRKDEIVCSACRTGNWLTNNVCRTCGGKRGWMLPAKTTQMPTGKAQEWHILKAEAGISKSPVKPPPSKVTKNTPPTNDVDGDIAMENDSDPYATWSETDLKAELERLQAALTHLHNNTAATQLITKQIGQVKEQMFASKRPGQRLDMAEKTARQATAAVQKAQEAITEHEKKTQQLQTKLQEAQRLEQEAQQKLAAVKAAVAEAATTAQAEAAPDLTETSANLIKAFIPQGVNATVQDQITIVMNQALAQMQSQVNLIVQTASATPQVQASQSCSSRGTAADTTSGTRTSGGVHSRCNRRCPNKWRRLETVQRPSARLRQIRAATHWPTHGMANEDEEAYYTNAEEAGEYINDLGSHGIPA